MSLKAVLEHVDDDEEEDIIAEQKLLSSNDLKSEKSDNGFELKTKNPQSGRNAHEETAAHSRSVSYLSLFRFATKWDIFVIINGIIFAFLKSLALPIIIIVQGEFTTLLVDRTLGIGTSSTTNLLPLFGGGKILTNATEDINYAEIRNDSMAFGILMALGIGLYLIAGIFAVDCFNHTALRQIARIRIEYFRSLLRQEIGWHDVAAGNHNFAARIVEDIEKIRDGIAEKVGQFLLLIMGFTICIAMSFFYGWKLSLVVTLYIPIILITNSILGKFQAKLSAKETNAYAAAANVAEEVLNGIRTVFAFGGEKKEIERYNTRLINAKKAFRQKGLCSGLREGIMRFLFYGSSAVMFWYGVRLVLDDRDKVDKEYTPTVLMITFVGFINGADRISKTAPFLDIFSAACGSAATISGVIDRKSKVDSLSNDGKVLDKSFQGNISFKKVSFSYPSRPDTQILRGLELEIKAGQSVALVGNSGNGKSTCLQLLQRFYDPDDGQISIDGCDIRSININSLRSHIATVGQEPILFSTTIGENIRYGYPNATNEDVITAAQNSGAHDFIAKLPQGYDTLVGEKGSQLSGGQKQRIAIARALIQNPKILLLDEATSALDYQSEKYVQETLDRVSQGRTTIVVSHRLSAIRDADRILFIDQGIVMEDGTHAELMALKGRYFEMISAGRMKDEKENETENKNDNENEHEITKSHEGQQKAITSQLSCEPNEYFRGLSVDKMEKKTKPAQVDIQYWKAFKRIVKLAKPEWFTLFLAAMSSIMIAFSSSMFSVLYAEIYGALSLQDQSVAFDITFKLCMAFLAVGAVIFMATIARTYFLSRAAVNLSTRVRSMTFISLLRQECAFYDDKNHSSARLSGRLTGDAANLQKVISQPLSVILQAILTFIIGLSIGFLCSAKLSFVCLAALPFIFVLLLLESKHMAKTTLAEKESTEMGIKIATEAIINIRTVASLRQERKMIERYAEETAKVKLIMRKNIIWRGLVNATSQSFFQAGIGFALCFGGFLVADKEIHYKNVIKTIQALFPGMLAISNALVFAPTITTAFVAAHRIFQIMDREPLINSPNVSNKSRKPDPNNNIEYKRVDFRYPTRPDVQILKRFSLNVEQGKTIALVGPSGCGKSTVIQLIQRLYDPEHGRIFIGLDEVSSDISLGDLRSKLSIVSQEPVLFEKTIAENIAYGDNSREVSMDEIIDAARVANVHSFIVQLPLGYETNVGSNSAQLSGGQKQRIAIARALVRNPNILLLDEATSALDLHSEQVVQEALETAQSGRTCLVIAHRLSTVQDADAICVLRNGSIVEYGTHNELLELGGIYMHLYNAQK